MSESVPLPEPVTLYHRPSFLAGEYIYITGHTPDQMHSHAAAVSAAKDARIKVLEDALRLALAELDELPAWSNAGYVCNIARAALEQTGHNARLTCPQGREEKA